MAETLRVIAPEAGLRLLRCAPDGGRGFLGLDPVTRNDSALALRLTERQAHLFTFGESTVLAAAVSEHNPRQAEVAVSSDDGEGLLVLLEHLRLYSRCTSFTAEAGADSPAAQALTDCGFELVGVLREHAFRSGHYHDVQLYHLDWSA